MTHNPETAPLYRALALIMTKLKEADEIRPERDHSNIDQLIHWDARRERFVYRAPDGT